MSRQGLKARELRFAGVAFALVLTRAVLAQDAPDEQAPVEAAPTAAAADAPHSAPASGDERSHAAKKPAAERDAGQRATSAIDNQDVIEMAEAGFAESTILAAIAANDTHFDVSPRALVALKGAGVSEAVIEAMLTAETANKKAASAARKAAANATAAPPPAELAQLSALVERLAAQQDAAAAALRAPDPPPSADPAPHAWILRADERTELPPTIAQVAFTDDKSGKRLETLQGLAGTALVFVNPAVGGIATTLGGLFHPANKDRTAIWALAGTAAPRALGRRPSFEVEFGQIPGVDPDEYRPALVRLVPTKDNYRLVAAAKTDGAKSGSAPDGPIVEEPIVTELKQVGRGRFRAAAKTELPAGEYALVLRPVERDDSGRRKRRRGEASLGELLGGGTSQILYFTWDFAVSR